MSVAEDKWPVVANVVGVMVRSGWKVEVVAHQQTVDDGIVYGYIAQGVRGEWYLEFQAAEGLVDEGALARKGNELGNVIRRKQAYEVIDLATCKDEDLEKVWKERFPE